MVERVTVPIVLVSLEVWCIVAAAVEEDEARWRKGGEGRQMTRRTKNQEALWMVPGSIYSTLGGAIELKDSVDFVDAGH